MRRAVVNVPSGSTDYVLGLPVGKAGQSIRVKAVLLLAGPTATAVTFNTKPAGAGTAISPQFQFGANGGMATPFMDVGWFETNLGHGLSVTTGVGSTVGMTILYDYYPNPSPG